MSEVGNKKWGKHDFWGLDEFFDPDWVLGQEQIILRDKLIDLCRTKIRPQAVESDRTYEFPRRSLDAMADLGLLGIIIPKEFGGLGQNNVTAAMIAETLARYGCPSTAMVYTMHLLACSVLLLRYHNNKFIQDLLRRINKEKLIGSTAFSDPATGGHIWATLSTKVKKLNENKFRILKYASWVTSAGFADWYAIRVLSPDFDGDSSKMCNIVVLKDEVRCSTDDWIAMGMHGNQSGPMIIDGEFSTERVIGPIDGGKDIFDEAVTTFTLLSSSVWNGISMACLDLAKKHVTGRAHADVGLRVCDYPTIQDYFGECLASTSASRSTVLFVGEQLDKVTNNNDWSLHADLKFLPRSNYNPWGLVAKYVSSENVEKVTDVMLHSCGGTGFKCGLGLERLLRDSRAAWLMGPSNEVARQTLGKMVLFGANSVDFWEQNCNKRVLHHELKKMDTSEKKMLAQKLIEEVKQEENDEKACQPFQDSDFDNPLNTCPPYYVNQVITTPDGIRHEAGLHPTQWRPLRLLSRTDITSTMASFVFALPNDTDHLGCLPGQYVKVRVNFIGKFEERYFSPVSLPQNYGKIELVLKFETHGRMSNYFETMKPGGSVSFLGPCGGFEYEPNCLSELTLIACGGGVTPALQLIRAVTSDPTDKTPLNLIYYSDSYEEILYREELDGYAAKDERFQMIHTLGEVPEDWQGAEGFIDTTLLDKCVTKPNGPKHKIVLCGGPTMVISCLFSLQNLGFSSDAVFVFGQFGSEQIRAVYGRNVKLAGHRCHD